MKVAGGLTKLATSGLTGSELGARCGDDGIPTSLPSLSTWISDSGKSRLAQSFGNRRSQIGESRTPNPTSCRLRAVRVCPGCIWPDD